MEVGIVMRQRLGWVGGSRRSIVGGGAKYDT